MTRKKRITLIGAVFVLALTIAFGAGFGVGDWAGQTAEAIALAPTPTPTPMDWGLIGNDSLGDQIHHVGVPGRNIPHILRPPFSPSR